jgi:hypothetical protein
MKQFPWEFDVLKGMSKKRRAKVENAKGRKNRDQQIKVAGRENYKKYGHPAWYSEYLRTPHWKAFKKRYRGSGRPRRCTICGEPRYELHHITYERIGDERLSDVVALCRAHHQRAHAREKKGTPLRTAHLEP